MQRQGCFLVAITSRSVLGRAQPLIQWDPYSWCGKSKGCLRLARSIWPICFTFVVWCVSTWTISFHARKFGKILIFMIIQNNEVLHDAQAEYFCLLINASSCNKRDTDFSSPTYTSTFSDKILRIFDAMQKAKQFSRGNASTVSRLRITGLYQ